MAKIALIGDVHTFFSEADVSFFNTSDFDLILFVGDLANFKEREGLAAARLIAQLQKPVILIPGNHDTVTSAQLLAEIKLNQSARNLLGKGQEKRVARFHEALGSVVVGGYSTHHFQFADVAFDVVVGRPYSMGGPKINFVPQLKRQFNVANMEESIAKLKQCVDQCQSENILFLAHNGPTGLGNKRDDIWGCDFWEEESDFGDPDLAEAIAYAKSQEKRVLGVFAGHMHHQLKGGGQRKWVLQRDDTTYLNAGLVPRIFAIDDDIYHHYLQIFVQDNQLSFEDCAFSPKVDELLS